MSTELGNDSTVIIPHNTSNFDKLVEDNNRIKQNQDPLNEELKAELEELNERPSDAHFELKRVPRRLIFVTVIFNLLSLTMLGMSIVSKSKGQSHKFWFFLVFAALLLLPGAFFLYYTIKLGITKDRDVRNTMLQDLPNMEIE